MIPRGYSIATMLSVGYDYCLFAGLDCRVRDRYTLEKVTAISTKLPSKRQKNEFYRYYAGYPINFALWALRQIDAQADAIVLDPWNGSGTTVAACASLGIECQGYDINPVMVHLGRARSASDLHFAEAREAVEALQSQMPADAIVDLGEVGSMLSERVAASSWARSTATAALFPFARARMLAAKTKNPSWFKAGGTLDADPIVAKEFFRHWHHLLYELRAWRTERPTPFQVNLKIELGDSRRPLAGGAMFDAVITSPPYLTRLDYVQATLPEYLLIREMENLGDIRPLRESMIGSPLTSDRGVNEVACLPVQIIDVLNSISRHTSKASSSYYYRFFSTYFVDLHTSLNNIAESLKVGGDLCIVVQSSHYKEIEVNLADSVIALGSKFGLHHQLTFDFDAKRSMASVNSRAHASARKPKNESAIFFKKG